MSKNIAACADGTWNTSTIGNSVAIRIPYDDLDRPTNLVIDQTGQLNGYLI